MAGIRNRKHRTYDTHIIFTKLASKGNPLLAFNCYLLSVNCHHFAVAEIINLQPRGSEGKPYQMKQIRQILLQYNLTGE
jgi:hypothetical protein